MKTMTEEQKFAYIISLMPAHMAKVQNAPAFISLQQIKHNLFAHERVYDDGTVFGQYRKIDGQWHKFKKDGSMYAYGLSRPCKDTEEKYIKSLPEYADFVLGDAYFA